MTKYIFGVEQFLGQKYLGIKHVGASLTEPSACAIALGGLSHLRICHNQTNVSVRVGQEIMIVNMNCPHPGFGRFSFN